MVAKLNGLRISHIGNSGGSKKSQCADRGSAYLLSPNEDSEADDSHDQQHEISTEWIDKVAAEISTMRDGAFGNILHDPVLGSVMMFITTAATGSGNEVFEFARHVLGIV